MSRETDTPSSGPNGRGGAAYPSGTPPYGIPAVPDAGTDAGRSAARPEERKTETTLTTRIRINIPGSRPIPPVVVRKPVKDAESKGPAEAEASAAPSPAPAPASAAETAALPALPTRPAQPAQSAKPAAENKPASDWFAPRKGGSGKGTQGDGSANGSGAPSGSGGAATGGAPAGPAAPAAPGGARPGAGRPGGVVGAMGAPGGPRPGATTGSGPTGTTGATGGPVAPGHGGGTGSFDVTEALAGGPAGNGTRPGADRAEPRRDDPPFVPDGGPTAPPGQRGPGGPAYPAGPQGPAGPTGGPVTGSGPMAPPTGGVPGGPGPAGVQQGGRPGAQPPGGTGLSDDTAILTPQQPAEPGTPGYGPRHDNVSGHTVTSGIPVVPPSAAFDAPGTGPAGPRAQTPPKRPEPAAAPPAGSAKPPKKKGRNKLVLLGTGVVVVLGVAYGAGLLMNSSDVPKGTTVLGVDIGGGTRDDAVKKLDAALDDRLNTPLKLSVDGRTVELQPDNAGLQLDTDATAGAAATSDYNPVNVIGSLFGQQRVVDPVMPVDEEKLQAALENAAGGAGSVTEGSITFESGKAVPVYPKAGQGIDVAKASSVVTEAYRTQVETGSAAAVNVPTSPQQPKVSKAEVDRMLKEFAEPAMSDIVTVQTDPAHSIPMSPEKSLWKFLRVQAVGGKLVDKPDLNALKELYGQTFDGVLITRGNGEKTAVTPQDVYGALRQALMSKTERIAVIETDPS
ncbi:hypothetical protein [Streptomyces pilosus]|uniref:Peptidoglycan binding domain-containing protein n=1 Tax=Streptomyces pilosus TaxID=28893 RepID=A0A918F0B8_9ACTN|nr:hypothetical protein [Streptomyces pilosus]GGQ89050.1 hypothetical protein GCM10010280_40580 [Streptomyces pilosus]